MTYEFKYKKINSLLWKTKKVTAHIKEQACDDIVDPKTKTVLQKNYRYIDAMMLKFEDGSVERIPEWSKYQMKLGLDWKILNDKQIKEETGKDSPT